jgi:uncharacterized protein (TIGR03118 family)
MHVSNASRTFCGAALMAIVGAMPGLTDSDTFYDQTNLVSDIRHQGRFEPNFVNAWGLDAGPTSPWWVNTNGTGLSFILDGAGTQIRPPVLATAIGAAGTSKPTGIVFNIFNGGGDFKLDLTHPAFFITATEEGTISGWNPSVNLYDTSVIKVNNHASGAIYKGLAIGQMSGQKVLYVANFHAGIVEVFDTNFSPVVLSSNQFKATLPPGFAPFNAQNVNGSIFVTYAKQDSNAEDDVAGPGNGYVAQFTQDGTLIRMLQHGNWMNSPWGVAQAPANFGELSGRLLIGMFGSGQIASFDPATGNFIGLMISHGNHPVEIDGLWGLRFGNGGPAGPTNVLFFTAGPDDESEGLFGTLTPKHAGKED